MKTKDPGMCKEGFMAVKVKKEMTNDYRDEIKYTWQRLFIVSLK